MLDHDVEHESIELGLRQRVRAFELDRVLRRKDVERFLELVGPALDGDPMLLHRLEKRRLGLGRRAVDFVRQDDVGEDWTRGEHHRASSRGRVLLHEIRAGDVGRHQVGRELDARELQCEHTRDGVNQQRLRQSRCADDQAVPPDEQGGQHLGDDLLLAHDDLAKLGQDLFPTHLHPIGQRQIVRGCEIHIGRGLIQDGSVTHGLESPSRVRISRVFSARSVTSRSSSLVYLAGGRLSFSSRNDSTRRSMSRRSR